MFRIKLKCLNLFAYKSLMNILKYQRSKITINYHPDVAARSKNIGFTQMMSLSIPFFGYNAVKEDSESDVNAKLDFNKKLEEADQLFLEDKYEDVVNVLDEYKNSNDVQVLWRLSRALYNMSLAEDINEDKRKNLILNAHQLILKALSIDTNIFEVHKWAAVLIDEHSGIIGIKERIKSLETVKYHMERALELNPKDPTIRYMIGYWCYSVADMPWYQRQIAATLFGASIPVSSYEEALAYFREAEKLQPLFYSKNLLMLGKTFLKMDSSFSAEYYLKLVVQYPAKTVEDHQAKKEAAKLLKSSFGY
ncbi:regulator of microtubule dynamics protein 1-like [Adelges cooleyi]|uniref:regulator of microtubule dynamics protein 1-like n=1 Tax=Adelges cooleyi TaxID=133065 RepID=UPI00217FB650|nr:regulator of microtubule dynamics protein 1-like [Adelges cooleyi]